MATRKKVSIIGPNEGGNVLISAWRGLYWLFGARATAFTPVEGGIQVEGLTFADGFDKDTIVADLTRKGFNRRLDWQTTFETVSGKEPEPFTTAIDMTNWMTAFLKGAGEDEGRSPQYAKDAINKFKIDNGLYVPRGRPRKTFSLDNIGELNPAALKDVPESEIEKLQEIFNTALANRSESPVPAEG